MRRNSTGCIEDDNLQNSGTWTFQRVIFKGHHFTKWSPQNFHTLLCMYVSLSTMIFSAWWNIAILQWKKFTNCSLNFYVKYFYYSEEQLIGIKKHNILYTIFIGTVLETVITNNFPLGYTYASHKYTHIFITFSLCRRLDITLLIIISI